MAFLKTADYDVLIRNEIAKIIDTTTEGSKLKRAEDMATAQMRNYLAGRYNVDAIFTPVADGEEDTRDAYIVMLAIDITLYHLWSKEGGNNVPELRTLRYTDALDWLKAIQAGGSADLPTLENEDGSEKQDIRLWSLNEFESNRF